MLMYRRKLEYPRKLMHYRRLNYSR